MFAYSIKAVNTVRDYFFFSANFGQRHAFRGNSDATLSGIPGFHNIFLGVLLCIFSENRTSQ